MVRKTVRSFCAVIILVVFASTGAAQESPTRANLVGPQALVGGVLRCEVSARIQLVMESTTAKLTSADLEHFRPTVTSSNEDVAQAVVDEDPRSSHILCADNGRAEVTYNVATLTMCVAVLVGTAQKEDSTPCSSGSTTVATLSGRAPAPRVPDKPVSGRLAPPEWLIKNGVMSCEPNAEWQVMVEAKTEKLEDSDLVFYPPRVSSSNESAVRAVVNDDPRSIQIKCGGSGRSEVSVRIADLTICLPIVVAEEGAAAQASPCTSTTTRPALVAAVPVQSAQTGAAAAATARPIETAGGQRVARAEPGSVQGRATTTARPNVPVERIARGIDDGPNSGPAPQNLKFTLYNPAFHWLSWELTAPRSHYQIYKKESLTWELVKDNLFASATAYTDSGFVAPGTKYRVVVHYSDGTAGSADITYTDPPQPAAPPGLTAVQNGTGAIKLTWQDAPRTNSYRLFGPGLPTTGVVTGAKTYQVNGLPVGDHIFTVVGDYDGEYEMAAASKVTGRVKPTSGKYRVVLLGVRATRETADDPLEFDGKRDEIYAAAFWTTVPYLRAPPTASGFVQTMTYGDVNNLPNRIQAGSASAKGGIRTGDAVGHGSSPQPGVQVFTDRFPLLVWEGTLSDSSEALIIAPTVWESDRNPGYNYTGWKGWWSVPNGRGGLMDAAAAERRKPGVNPAMLSYTEESSGVAIAPGVEVTQGMDRPIGSRRINSNVSSGWWFPYGPVLTREKLEAALGSNQAVTVTQHASDELYLAGVYEIYLQFERR